MIGLSKVIDALGDFIDARRFPLAFITIVAGLICGVVWTSIWMSRTTCNELGTKMGIETEYSVWTGCMIRVRSTWLPWSDVVPIERDGKIVFEPKPVVHIGK